MFKNAQEAGLIIVLVNHLLENGIVILQYADDIIFMLDGA
jgi:hypothetical protein